MRPGDSLNPMDERPPPSPEKLLNQFQDWASETELPGRTMSYLKTGFLPEVLAEQSEVEGVAEMVESWATWEAGKTDPAVVLAVLQERGIEALLAGLAES